MDIGKAFGFVFQDEKWVTKVLLGGLFTIIPIVNFAVLGYMLKVAQNVAQGHPRPLPEWGEFGDHFMRGLYAVVISIVYFLPYIILVILLSCVTTALGAGAGDSESAGAAVGLLSCLFVPIFIIVALLCLMLSYAGMARYVMTNNLSDALKFGEVFAMVRSRPGTWLMLLLVNLLASFAAGLGVIACGIGVLFTGFIAYCVLGHALGQIVAQQGMASGAYYQTPPSYGPPSTY